MATLGTHIRFNCCNPSCGVRRQVRLWTGRIRSWCSGGAVQQSPTVPSKHPSVAPVRQYVRRRGVEIEDSAPTQESNERAARSKRSNGVRGINQQPPHAAAATTAAGLPCGGPSDQGMAAAETAGAISRFSPPRGRLEAECPPIQPSTSKRSRHSEPQGFATNRSIERPVDKTISRGNWAAWDASTGPGSGAFPAPPGTASVRSRGRNRAGPASGGRAAGGPYAGGDGTSRGSSSTWTLSAPGADSKQINTAIMDAGMRRSYLDILQLVADRGRSFNRVNVATALHRLGSCALQPGGYEARRLLADPRFTQLERLADSHVPSFGPREVANCLWALAKLGYQPAPDPLDAWADDALNGVAQDGAFPEDVGGRLLATLCARAEEVAEGLSQQEVTNALWALGTLGYFPGESLLRSLSRRLLAVLPEVAPQGVAGSLLGLAKLGWSPGPDMLDRLSHGSLPKVAEFNPQALSNTLWSLARLSHPNARLQAAIFQQALRQLPEFNPQGISNLVWAAATLGLRVSRPRAAGGGHEGGHGAGGDVPEPLLRRACDQAVATLQSFTPQNVSNLLWATAKLGFLHEPLLRAAAGQAARQLAADTEAVAAKEEMEEEGALQAEPGRRKGNRGSSGVRGWVSQEVANTIWAFATLGVQPGPEFLRQVCRHLASARHLPAYKWQELANAVWALAVLGHRDSGALNAVERHVAERLEAQGKQLQQLHPQQQNPHSRALRPPDVSMLLWAYASLQHPARALFAALLPELARRPGQFSDPELNSSLWAAATLGVYNHDVMESVAEHVCAYRLPYLHVHHVAGIAWAYSELRHAHTALFDGLVARAVSYPPDTSVTSAGSAGDVLVLAQFTRLCCAVGVFGWRYPQLVAATARRLAAVCGSDGSIVTAAADAAPSAAAAATKAAVAAAWTVAGAAAAEPPAHRVELLVANLAWGLSLVGACSPQLWDQMMELMGPLAAKARERGQEQQPPGGGGGGGGGGGDDGGEVALLPDEALRQLYQAYMHVQLDHPDAVLAPGPPGLLERAATVWRFRSSWAVQVSDLQRQVAEALIRLGLQPSVERLTDDGDFSIDLALELKLSARARAAVLAQGASSLLAPAHDGAGSEQQPQPQHRAPAGRRRGSGGVDPKILRVAVEVDGPSHFTANTRQPLGPTLYRRRCLEARGWRVVSVPYWRWCEDPDARPSECDALLRELLGEAGLGEGVLTALASGPRRRRRAA